MGWSMDPGSCFVYVRYNHSPVGLLDWYADSGFYCKIVIRILMRGNSTFPMEAVILSAQQVHQ